MYISLDVTYVSSVHSVWAALQCNGGFYSAEYHIWNERRAEKLARKETEELRRRFIRINGMA